MTILQRPDAISFCGNLNDFVVTGLTGNLIFKLSVSDTVIVDELYNPENGKVTIRFKDVINEMLSITVPSSGVDVYVQSEGAKDFHAIVGDQEFDFKVVKGGIGNVAETSAVFMKTQWLTLQPQHKQITIHQPEYLSYFSIMAGKVKVKAYFVTGSEEKHIVDITQGNLYTIDISYGKISGRFTGDVGFYDVWVEDSEGNRLTYIQRYILTEDNADTNMYLFESTLGGVDTVAFSGRFIEKVKTDGTISTILDEYSDSDIDFSYSCEQNTGYIPGIEYARWLRGFFVSRQRYHVTDTMRRIYIQESENEFQVNGLNNYTFEFLYSKQTKYDYVIRNNEDLPRLLEFPGVDSLPFLAPRLSEYPIAAIADDLMLPAQFAFEDKWRRISIAAIIQAAIGASVDAAQDSIDLSNYWKKTELVRDQLYLKFLDEKIKAGYADESGNSLLWEKHHFLDYLNQAVKRDSDVEFRSVLTQLVTSASAVINDLRTDDFLPGMSGTGFGIVNKSEAHMDKAVIRKSLEVLALVVQKMYWRGGMQVLSPAGMKVSKVEEGETFWRCYMENSDGQTNDFVVNDQARCNRMGNNPRYYWNLVVSVGSNYIDLSKTDKDGNDVPEIGDDLIQLGNRVDTNRQWAVIDSSLSADAGTTIYRGINSFSLSGKAVARLGVDPLDPTKVGIFTDYGRFENVEIGTGCTGLGNFEEYGDVARDIQAAQEAAVEAARKAAEAQSYIDNTLPLDFAALQKQIDGQVESFFFSYDPTLLNAPAASWLTEADKEKHLNDTFTNTSTGASWRFLKIGNIYSWVEIADTATKEALRLAGEAKDTADGKRRCFVVQPTTPYEIGDLWAQGVEGDFMRCVIGRLSGSYVSSDWEKASKYTDDTRANEALGRMNKMAEDGVLTKEEKAKTRQEMATLEKEYASLVTRAASYGLTYSGLTAAKNAFVSYLTGTAKVNENTDTNISVPDYSTKEAGYKVEVQLVSDQIAKKVADGAVANIQIGSVNLISKKMLFRMNEIRANSAIWKQDSDGIYLDLMPYNSTLLFDNFKANTQYIVSAKFKGNPSGENLWRPNLAVEYVDGTAESCFLVNDSVLKTTSFVSKLDGSIKKLYWNTANNGGVYSLQLYDILLIEGNKPVNGFPLSNEDQTGVSNVNLLDNSKFQFGTKGYAPNQSATLNVVNGVLQVRSSQTTSTPGVQLPVVSLKAGVYSFKMRIARVNVAQCYIQLFTANVSQLIYNYVVDIDPNMSDKEVKFAVPLDDDYRVLIMLNASSVASYPGGFNIEYSMLTEGFLSPASWSASQNDVEAKAELIAQAEASLAETRANAYADGVVTDAEQSAIDEAQRRLDALQFGGRNLLLNSGILITNGGYYMTGYTMSINLVVGKKYTFVIRGTTTGGQYFAVYMNGGYYRLLDFGPNKDDEVIYATFTATTPTSPYERILNLYNFPSTGSSANPATIKWAALYEGEVKPPMDWTAAPEDVETEIGKIQPGTRNLIRKRQEITMSKSDYPNNTTYVSVLNSNGERETIVTCAVINVNNNRYTSIHERLTTPLSASFYVYSFDYKTNHAGGKISIDIRTPDMLRVFDYYYQADNTGGVWKRGHIICDWTKFTTETTMLISIAVGNTSTSNYISYRNLKLVRGNRGWDDSEAPEDTEAKLNSVEPNTKDSFAKEIGYTNFQDLITKASTKGKLVVNGLLNADVIDTKILFSSQAFIDKLNGHSFNFTSGNVGGFTIEDYTLQAGAKFGAGAGIALQALTGNYGLNIYKDSNNYVEMFQRTSEWGLKGVSGGSVFFQFGSTNKIGGFEYTESQLRAISGTNNMKLSATGLEFSSNLGSIKISGNVDGSTPYDKSLVRIERGDFSIKYGTFYVERMVTSGSVQKDIVIQSCVSFPSREFETKDRSILIIMDCPNEGRIKLKDGYYGQELIVVNGSNNGSMHVESAKLQAFPHFSIARMACKHFIYYYGWYAESDHN